MPQWASEEVDVRRTLGVLKHKGGAVFLFPFYEGNNKSRKSHLPNFSLLVVALQPGLYLPRFCLREWFSPCKQETICSKQAFFNGLFFC